MPSIHPVYADRAALAASVGNPTGQDERLDIALVMASRWVDRKVGLSVSSREAGDEPILPVDTTALDAPVSLVVLAVDVGARNATLVAAARFLRSGDIPFGVAGGMGDLAIRVFADIPEAEMHLFGLKEAWGVA